MSVEQKRRELFEKVFSYDLEGWARFNGTTYEYTFQFESDTPLLMLNLRWEGFNAALDAVEIELPEVVDLFDDFGKGHFVSVMDTKKSIESTGLGLKVKL